MTHTKSLPIRCWALVGLCLALFTAGSCAGTRYRILELSLPTHDPSASVSTLGINASGEVLGQYTGDSQTGWGGRYTRSVVWGANGAFHEIGNFPGAQNMASAGLNDLGQVAGLSIGDDGLRQAFVYSPVSGLAEVGPRFVQGGDHRQPFNFFPSAINGRGEMIGSGWLQAPAQGVAVEHVIAWSPVKGFIDTQPGKKSSAHAIDLNDRGQWLYTTPQNGSLVTRLADRQGGFQELSRSNGFTALFVNEKGAVAGHELSPLGYPRAFVWRAASGTRLIGTLGCKVSYALGLNNLGQVVGTSCNAQDPSRLIAFVYDEMNLMQPLENLLDPADPLHGSFENVTPSGINDQGQIVATARRLSDGVTVPLVLNPIAAFMPP